VEGHKDGEDTFWPAPWGQGRQAGISSARRWRRKRSASVLISTEGARTSCFPTTRTRQPQTPRGAGEELARIWMHNGMIQSTGEKMAKSVGNIAPLHEVIGQYGRDAVVMYLASALSSAAGVLGGGAGAGQGQREPHPRASTQTLTGQFAR